MAKFRVPFKAYVTVYVTVEADNTDEAIEKAEGEVYLDGYVGNGGNGDKLIGVNEKNISIEASDVFDVVEEDVEKL